MKALRVVLLPILFVLLMTVRTGHAEETQARRLTLMIYMCGSNLESGFGAATEDIEEMKAAGLRGNEVTVLLMTGGTKQWVEGYDASQCLIHELGPRGTRIVWRSESKNMGEAETLTHFLQFGHENYPAANYALILWDHGGGPNEGVCWDELFSLDRLSLQELSLAIEKACLGQKLEWIGFDACLMGSLEVACAMAPYADYMIASQETEPSLGWDYSFLCELPLCSDGAESGRLIAKKYLENRVLSGEILTMACLDLSKAQETAEQTGQYFSRYKERLDSDFFAHLSSVRSLTTGFGKGVEGSGNDGYDLVDLKDLVDRIDQVDGSASALSTQIQDMVICSQSNRPGVNGISIYYPFENKSKYESTWRKGYQDVTFHSGYSAYMDAFGRLLMGEPLIDWSGLSAVYEGIDGEGNHYFSLPLTAEQREGLVSAELLILQETPSSEAGKTFVLLTGSERVSLDQGNILSAVYMNRSLQAVAQDGRVVSPISLYPSRERDAYTTAAILMPPEGGLDAEKLRTVFFDLGKEQLENQAEIYQVRILDEDTDSITNRYAYSEEGFGSILFWSIQKRIPTITAQGILPGFSDWPDDRSFVMLKSLSLPQSWHFEYTYEPMLGKNTYAVFQLTDTQHNTYCTTPILITDSSSSAHVISPDIYDSNDFHISTEAYTDGLPGEEQLKVHFDIENKSEQAIRFYFRDLVVNGHRQTHLGNSIDIQASQTGTCTVVIPTRELSWLDQMTDISASLIMKIGSDYSDPVTLHFHFPAFSLEHLANEPTVMQELTIDNVIYRLMSIDTGVHNIHAVVYIENHGISDVVLEKSCLLNGFADLHLSGVTDAVAPENSCFFDLSIDHDLYFLGHQFSTGFTAKIASMVYFAGGLQTMGVHSLQSITFHESLSEQAIQFSVDPAIQLHTDPVPSNVSTISAYEALDQKRLEDHIPILLLQSNQVIVQAEWVLTGNRGIAICCTMINNGNASLKIILNGFMLNETEVVANHYYDELSFELRPNSTQQQLIVLGDTNDSLINATLHNIVVRIKCGKEAVDHVCEVEFVPVILNNTSVVLDGNQLLTSSNPYESFVLQESTESGEAEAKNSDVFYRSGSSQNFV